MQYINRRRMTALAVSVAAAIFASAAIAAGAGDHTHDHDEQQEMIEQMRSAHEGHDHAHDFDALEDVSEEDMHRTMDAMIEIGLVLPPMNSQRGADLFLNKGCIACHQVNDVGGQIGPSLNAEDMPEPMNAFEFAARMWRGAPAMAAMQEDLLGQMINISGQELADIIAFAHDEAAQSALTADRVPEEYRRLFE